MRGPDEVPKGLRVTSKGGFISCSNCGATNHNMRSCMNKLVNQIGRRRRTKSTKIRARKGRRRGKWENGALCGIRNWNGVGMSNRHHFRPPIQHSPIVAHLYLIIEVRKIWHRM
ncbi:hypothetical protein CDL12_21543 [Handroanthus impetiginosus]|uniref:Uncharacterized protein n=1 Tax=Handroanthus impetiginosus TaxID=429701 RepID=A0A2G9GKT4_9LAMI|nr:hypothetical protein CDL12_21543 [Handroanthus impetiginosus]